MKTIDPSILGLGSMGIHVVAKSNRLQLRTSEARFMGMKHIKVLGKSVGLCKITKRKDQL